MAPRCIPEEEFTEEFMRPASGAGGQHVNKTTSGVRLHWNFANSAELNEEQKGRLRVLAAAYVQGDELVLLEHSERSLIRNREIARIRMQNLFRACLPQSKTRKPTKPTKSSQERRLKSKAARGRIKALRGGRGNDF